MCSKRSRRSTWPALAAAALALIFAAPAGAAMTLVPPKPDVLLGVSDQGTAESYERFTELTGKHAALLETYVGWGKGFNAAYERWRTTQTRPIIHIATEDKEFPGGFITPEQIALGQGDNYLIQMNQFFASHNVQAYIRPLGEPNRCLNPWSGVECDGTLKGGEYSALWYKQAFRRIVAIVRGGLSLEGLNAELAEIGLPPLNRTSGPPPLALPIAPVSIIWSPLPGGSPRVKGNYPGNYWPGSKWVDWVGTDFYSKYPVWQDLNRFYEGKQWKGKPVAITEWAVQEKDEPSFVSKLITWIVRHKRVQMLSYYQGFGPGNPYELGLYPRTTDIYRQKIRRANFLPYAENNVGVLPPLPPKEKKAKAKPPTKPHY
ncbi:MAG: hypothetical protein JSU06_01235 [Actinobacteria bacterium]|nr:hypothetical protein [Actinomycetota bacterium]